MTVADDPARGSHSRERTDFAGKIVRNRILESVPDAEFRVIRPHLEFLPLSHHSILHEPSRNLKYVYFPNSGLISLVVAMEDGKTVEAAVVGREGAAGLPSAVSLMRSPLREVVQIPGEAFRVNVAALRRILNSAPDLQMTLSRYAVVQGIQVAQTAACNRLHDLEQRLARWLLMAQDRVASASLFITHDFLATMLGTDRPSVSLAAGVLQKKRNIAYTRGAVKILNRRKLENSACECYAVIQQFNAAIGL
ncbi:MAG TPA: Crp/Fnr family transcriptional regulator [Candidatus Baltobacteraceae bacterium]|nr:Crp/Fnr family transcriptional regulator [Candidatus Baltobacteraceae bacterium]